MPVMKYYEIDEERRVRVRATSPADAIQVADAAFKGNEIPEEKGSLVSEIETMGLNLRKDD